MDNLPANQRAEWVPSLAEQEARKEHREWIGGRVLTLLSHFWREDDDLALTAAIGADWADVLEGLPQDAIKKACTQYLRESGRRKPTPGEIYTLAREHMPRPQVVRPRPEPEPAEKRVTPEVDQKICEDNGFVPKKFGGENEL